MNKFALGLIAGVLVTCGLSAWKINDVASQHDAALKEFSKDFDMLHSLVKSGMVTKEDALKEYEIIHTRGAKQCLAHTLDRNATKMWLDDIYKVNIELIKTVIV